MGMSSSDWSKLHPIRWKRMQQKYRMRHRKPCLECGRPIPFPSVGRKRHRKCQETVRIRQQRESGNNENSQDEFSKSSMRLS